MPYNAQNEVDMWMPCLCLHDDETLSYPIQGEHKVGEREKRVRMGESLFLNVSSSHTNGNGTEYIENNCTNMMSRNKAY